jgi:ankyrin repeat protein
MIELGANINAKDEKGFSVLFTSLAVVAKDNQEKIKLLIQSGADVNATDNNNETPLFWANWCDADVIKAFVDAGADVNTKNNQGRTPLFYAVRCCKNPNTIKALVELGADVNIYDNCGKMALDYAPNESVARKILTRYKPR